MIVHKVVEWEFERGWGSKPIDVYYFPSEELAISFARKYSETHNTSVQVPDWYLVQEYRGTAIIDSKEDFDKHKYKGDLIDMPEWEFK